MNSFFRETGLLVLGKKEDPLFEGVLDSFKQNSDAAYTLHDPKGLNRTYPNLTMGPEVWGCYDPVAGVLMADKALKTLWTQFVKNGGTIIDNSPVKEIVPMETDKIKIHLIDGKVLSTKSVVICAGPWTNKLTEPLG